jgi:hypothetical protein
MTPYLKKLHHKKRLVEWLKVKALSSNPNTGEKKSRGWGAVSRHKELRARSTLDSQYLHR